MEQSGCLQGILPACGEVFGEAEEVEWDESFNLWMMRWWWVDSASDSKSSEHRGCLQGILPAFTEEVGGIAEVEVVEAEEEVVVE